MTNKVNQLLLGFDSKILTLRLEDILPRHMVQNRASSSRKYNTILQSIKTSGIVEPLVVYKNKGDKNYVLLDGHWRYFALKELKISTVECLVSLSDESFTYNHYVNRLSIIQEQRMILKAIEKGVPKEDIAKALNVNVSRIVSKKNLLRGLCPEAVERLKDKRISESALQELKKVQAIRQIEIADLMVGMNNYKVSYARTLVAATSKELLKERSNKSKSEALRKMEREMNNVEKEYLQAEENYGANICNLTLFISYVKRLLDNSQVVTYLSKEHHDIFLELDRLAREESL